MNYDFDDIKEKALGQWGDILRAFGIEPKKGNVPCVLCGGHDRAYWKNTGGKIFQHCRHCGTHFADQLLLELAFGNDFARMCKELGEYLHCQPAERQNMVRSQAAIAQASGGNIELVQDYINRAHKFASKLTRDTTAPALTAYGIGHDCYRNNGSRDAYFPMLIAGKLVDWMRISEGGQHTLTGKVQNSARVTLKPSGEVKHRVIVTADMIDAIWLYYVNNEKTIIVCAGSLRNMEHVARSFPVSVSVIMAVPHTFDGLDALMTCNYSFITPNQQGRKFCDYDYKYRPDRVYMSSEVNDMYESIIMFEEGVVNNS